jgi:hypothetical protein
MGWSDFLGGVAGGIGGFFLGGPVGAAAGYAAGSELGGQIGDALGGSGEITGGGGADPITSIANASRDAAIAQSNAQVQMASLQAATMQLGILKSSQDAQFQTLAWLTERLDHTDATLQIAVENAKIAFQQESDHHMEAMKGLENDARQQEIDAADREREANTVSTDMLMA